MQSVALGLTNVYVLTTNKTGKHILFFRKAYKHKAKLGDVCNSVH